MARTSEIWRAIPGYEGRYEVSDCGQVRSLTRIVQGGSGPRLLNARIRKQSIGSHGYCVVSLSRESIVTVYCVNRLVLMAFNTAGFLSTNDACHNDGNKTNNHLSNLRWDDRVGNAADRKRHGTHLQGSSCPVSKLNESQVKEIKALIIDGIGTTTLGAKYSVAVETINSIKCGKSWKHV